MGRGLVLHRGDNDKAGRLSQARRRSTSVLIRRKRPNNSTGRRKAPRVPPGTKHSYRAPNLLPAYPRAPPAKPGGGTRGFQARTGATAHRSGGHFRGTCQKVRPLGTLRRCSNERSGEHSPELPCVLHPRRHKNQ